MAEPGEPGLRFKRLRKMIPRAKGSRKEKLGKRKLGEATLGEEEPEIVLPRIGKLEEKPPREGEPGEETFEAKRLREKVPGAGGLRKEVPGF